MTDKQPFDPIKGAFIIMWMLIAVSAIGGLLIFLGCFYGIAPLCDRGSGIRDVVLEILALVGITLGRSGGPPHPPRRDE